MTSEKERSDQGAGIHDMEIAFDDTLDLSPSIPLDPKALPAVGGVYLLSDGDDRPIFLGFCENLRRVVPPRLAAESAEPSKRAKLGEIARRVSWKRTRGAYEGLLWHWRFAKQLFPGRYNAMLGFGPCWFLRIEPTARYPRFEAVSALKDDAARYFGPMPRRKDAESLVRLLEDAFDLCRYHDILLKTPNGERCAYYDMGRCPAPCDGTVPMSSYRASIAEAVAFLERRDGSSLEPVRRRMQRASDGLAFECAAAYKRVHDDAGSLWGRKAFTCLSDVKQAGWLAIIRAGVKRKNTDETLLKAYFMVNGHFLELARGRCADIESLSNDWKHDMAQWTPSPAADARDVTNSMRLISRFLFKDNQRDVFVAPMAKVPAGDQLKSALVPLVDIRRHY